MLKNYWMTALRIFRRNKVFTAINVLGLSVGLSAALVIFLIVRYDFSFDKFHKDGDRIYRVVSDMKFANEPFYNSGVPYPLPEAAQKELSGIDASTAFWNQNIKVTIPDAATARPQVFKNQEHVIFADPYYFKLFSFYHWVAGSPETALAAPFQVVLTEERAKTYFPGSDPSRVIGRTIVYDDSTTATVTGIVKDPTAITDFTFKEFVSRSSIPISPLKKDMSTTQWGSINSASQFFVRLTPGTRPAQVEARLAQLAKKYSNDRSSSRDNTVNRLQPLADIHFNDRYDNFDQRLAHKPTLYGLILVAAFLLLLGCINFINLATAQSIQRAKEIGIRKTLGSSAKQLIMQFLGETFLLTLTALLLSLALTPWLLHIFSDFIPAGLHFQLLQQPDIFLFLGVLLAVITLLSGFYPAWVLTRFQPVLVMKNQAFSGTPTTRKAWLRKILTVSQFAIAQVFIMATLIVGRQIRYSLDADLGFKKEAIVYFRAPVDWHKPDGKAQALLDKIQALPGIERASLAGAAPASTSVGMTTMKYNNGKQEIQTDVQQKDADTNYFRIYHLRLLAGRPANAGDTSRDMVINQTYANLLGFTDPQKALGIQVGNKPIVGVVADFHQASTHTPIKPMALFAPRKTASTIHIALVPPIAGTLSWKETLARVGAAYKEIYPEETFSYTFFDESIAKFYAAEQNIARLLKWATGLTIFISCLGLIGLVIYTTNLRTKEIGIRKVLGASATRIVSLLSKDFIGLMGIAFLIATPLAWWALHTWLENFAYRATIAWWIFPLSGGSMIGIALLVMSIRTIRAALANPIGSLRSE